MSSQIPAVDPGGLQEFSVVFNDRSLNHMSQRFQQVMRDLQQELSAVYQAATTIVVPGGGTFAMETVARQFATGKRALVIRNGWFSYRWTQIFEMGAFTTDHQALLAAPIADTPNAAFAPVPIEQARAEILALRPDVVFAPHVETSAGLLLPDDYVRELGAAAREVGALFVLDCVASGAAWIDMAALNVDVLISAPQKGWSASPCAGLVMLGERGLERLQQTRSNSFACDLRKWHEIMQAYVQGGHAYHATMPTDGLRQLRDAVLDTLGFGLEAARRSQFELGNGVRAMLAERGFESVAATGFEAPGVVVCYTDNEALHKGVLLAQQGVQIAAGVPLMCNEPEGFRTFRIGLFGLSKLADVPGTLQRLSAGFDAALG